MDSRPSHVWSLDAFVRTAQTGAFVGALIAGAQAFEILRANPHTLTPGSTMWLLSVWIVIGATIGSACGSLGGRAFAIIRLPPLDGATFLSLVVTGHVFLPIGFGPTLGLAVVPLRLARRRIFPRNARLDQALPLFLALGVFTILEQGLPPESTPPTEQFAVSEGAPLPGSIPVTITVHGPGAFPEVPALHLPLRELACELPGAAAALWTGRAPARTRVGQSYPRELPFGGGLSVYPHTRPVRFLVAFFSRHAQGGLPPFRVEGSLAAIVEAAGIPILTGVPETSDPPLFLRVLQTDGPPDSELAGALQEGSAWLDVTIDADRKVEELAVSGIGVELTPLQTEASLLDMVPTALHLLGLAVPREVDGRVLLELLESPGPGSRAPRYRALLSGDDKA